jgi:dynein light intermediate chain
MDLGMVNLEDSTVLNSIKTFLRTDKTILNDKKNIELSDDKNNQENENSTEEILKSIFPPQEMKDDEGKIWYLTVSTTPAKVSDVLELQKSLDQQLQIHMARETGICRIREQLYSNCFDELIR